MTLLLVFVFCVFSFFGFPEISLNNIPPENVSNFFIPYGAILFSFMALGAVPELKEMLKKKKTRILSVITTGLVFSAVIYYIFTIIVVGISGSETSSEAIFGLTNILPKPLISLLYLFAFLSIFTSYLNFSLLYKKILMVDRGVPKNYAWAIAVFLPLILYMLGVQNFIVIIGIIGSVFVGITGILLVMAYLKLVERKTKTKLQGVHISKLGVYFLIVIFLIGVVAELIKSALKYF